MDCRLTYILKGEDNQSEPIQIHRQASEDGSSKICADVREDNQSEPIQIQRQASENGSSKICTDGGEDNQSEPIGIHRQASEDSRSKICADGGVDNQSEPIQIHRQESEDGSSKICADGSEDDQSEPIRIHRQASDDGSSEICADGATQFSITPPYFKYESRHKEILKPWALTPTHYYRNHVLFYDTEKRIPRWAAEHLTAQNITGAASRNECRFQSNEERFVASKSDYKKKGVIQGHLAASGNHKSDQVAMQETFFYTNICPQYENKYWNDLEEYCRRLTKKFPSVYIISGSAFLAIEENGERIMRYKILGENLAIPTHLYKIILVEGPNDVKALEVFMVANQEPVDTAKLLHQFSLPNIRKLEDLTGLEYLRNEFENQIKRLSDVDAYASMGQRESGRFLLYKQLTEQNFEVREISLTKKKRIERDPVLKELCNQILH